MSGPGKFEGEPEWVEEYWDSALQGGADEEITLPNGAYSLFKINTDDAASWPDLKDVYGVILHEDSQGFVNSEEYENQEDYEAARNELQEMADNGESDDDEEDDDEDEEESPFTYTVDIDERGEFRATVYDPSHKDVFEVNEETIEDGFMRNKRDLDGLKSHLVSLGIMTTSDRLENDG